MYKTSLVFVWVLLFGAAISLAEPKDIGFTGYAARLWEAQDGLPDQSVQTFAQTPDGYLWIGTKGGLVRFDGSHFAVYSRDIAPAQLERGVNCLLVGRDGSLWIGTEGGGLVRYRDRHFQIYPTSDGLANGFVRALYQGRDGTVWVGSDQGLFQVGGSSLTRIDNRNGVPRVYVWSIVEGSNGHIWVGGNHLLEIDKGLLLRTVDFGNGHWNLVLSMCATRDGTVWVGTLTGLERLLPSGTLMREPGFTGQVSGLGENTDGRLWIGTVGQGLYYHERRGIFHIAQENLPSQTVRAIFEDREHNVWLGTQAGIVRLSGTSMTIVPLPRYADSEFETLYRDTDGSIWVAGGDRLFRIRSGMARLYVFSALPHLRVRTLVRDPDSSLWLGSEEQGLFHIQGTHVRQFHAGYGLSNNFVQVLLMSRDGSIWVGTDGGLTQIKNSGSRIYSTSDGLAYSHITALCEDREGGIWVGTSRGLTHIVGGHIVQDSTTRALAQEQLWSIVQDAAGVVWFGTGNGLYGLRAGNILHLTKDQGLANNTIYQVLDDSHGNLWLGSANSISRFHSRDLDLYQQGSRVYLTLFKDPYDLQSAVLYSGIQRRGLVDANGNAWFPSNKGILRIKGNEKSSVLQAPVVIEQVRAEGQLCPPSQRIVLKPSNGRLEIYYTAIHLSSQSGLRYRYKMEGLEGWNEVFSRRTAYYTHLPPGKYIFRVQAYDSSGPESISEASIEIVQQPHFYATIWFRTSCIVALLGIVVLIYRLRLHQMRMRFQVMSEERTRLAREMHDTVIQGCVGVSTLLEAALGVEPSEEPLRQQLLNYATDQMRSTIEDARDAVWALRNTSASTAHAGTICENLARQFEADSGLPIGCHSTGVPFMLTEQATHELMMTIREALSNAIAHADAKEIELHVCFTEHGVKIEVRDDGCGFEESVVLGRGGHYGIVGMRERVWLLKGSLQIESSPGKGTSVRISLPRKLKFTEKTKVGDAGRQPHKD